MNHITNPIESLEFAAHLNIASSLNMFIDILSNSTPFVKLKQFLQSPQAKQQLLNHISHITAQPFNKQYEHPLDLALATYLFALQSPIAARLTQNIPNLHWTTKIANTIISCPLCNNTGKPATLESIKCFSLIDNTPVCCQCGGSGSQLEPWECQITLTPPTNMV